jgi:M3 family oligoendopeptidase
MNTRFTCSIAVLPVYRHEEPPAILNPTPAIQLPSVTAESLAADYDAIESGMQAAPDLAALLVAIEQWDQLRRRLRTARALVNLRYRQNTGDEEARSAREHYDALEPQILARASAIKRRLLNHERRRELEAHLSPQAFRLWETDLKTYAPEIDDKLVRESKLEAEYNRIFGSITVQFEGRRMTFAELRGYANAPNRALRESAERARWGAIESHGDELDALYSQLVAVRDEIGKALGAKSFTPIAYARLQRIDWDAHAVTAWRDAVAKDVVPLVEGIFRRVGERRGNRTMAWDEAVLLDKETAPIISGEALLEQLPEILGAVDRRLGDFATFMRDRRLLDVFPREGKGPGGFCTSFPTEGYPFIFASFNGTKDDVNTLLHEMGHAFQSYLSRNLRLEDYLAPTSEACEIHSIGMEFFAWPVLERYFGQNADTVRVEHLASRLMLLCYGCAIDHFQHLVFERPKASPNDRRGMWLEVERRYMPWRDYGDIAYAAKGNAWQPQLHVYTYPFYYIDYTLAACCALQFWDQALRNRNEAMERYVALCERGGQASFRELISTAGLKSPFEPHVLENVVERAQAYLRKANL